MKRTLVLIGLALLVFGGAYFVMALLLPNPSVAVEAEERTLPMLPRPGEGTIGPTEGVTLRTHDPATGQPVAEIQIGKYNRESEQIVRMADITATFLMEGGAAVVLTSPIGRVQLEAAADSDELDAASFGAADTGTLQDVEIAYYRDATKLAGPPTLVATVPVLVFDQTRLTLATVDTEIEGRTVFGDEVPVTVRGDDFDFDGQGLLVRWDAQRNRPRLVRITKGRELVVKRPGDFFAGTDDTTATNAAASWASPIMLASLQDAGVAEALSASADDGLSSYLLRLENDLRVLQGGEQLVRANWLEAVLPLSESKRDRLSLGGEREAQQPETPAGPESSADSTTDRAAPASTLPAETPAKREEPIILRWDGPVVFEPLQIARPDELPLASSDGFRMRMQGAPLVFSRGDLEARGGTLSYDRDADDLQLMPVEGEETIRLADGDGNTLVVPELAGSFDLGEVMAVGRGFAELSGKEPATLRWGDSCTFTFVEDDDGKRRLRDIEAVGDVSVEHTRLRLSSQQLGLRLAPDPASSANRAGETADDLILIGVDASDQVLALLLFEGKTVDSFLADELDLDMPAGPAGPIEAMAAGDVEVLQGGRQLMASRITADLKPDDTGRHVPQRVEAIGDVEATDTRGRVLRGGRAVLEGPDQPLVVFAVGSQPATLALAPPAEPGKPRPADVTLSAEQLKLSETDESLLVPVAGEIVSTVAGPGDTRLRRFARWANSFRADAQRATMAGGVEFGVELGGQLADGTDVILAGETAELRLLESVAIERDDDARDTTPRISPETIEQFLLTGGIKLNAEQTGDDDVLLRSVDVIGTSLDVAPNQSRLTLPGRGEMLLRDLRPEPEDPNEDRGFRGNIAVRWNDAATYVGDAEQAGKGVVEFAGRALAAFEPVGRPVFRIEADAFVGNLLPDAAGRASFAGAVATGDVVFTADNGVRFEAGRVTFDPETGQVVAIGSADAPITAVDKNGVPTGELERLVYNVETGLIDEARGLRSR